MALKIPEYQQTERSTPLRPYAEPRVINPAAGLTQGLSHLGSALQEAEKKRAQLEAEDALQQFVRQTNDLLLSGQNPYYGTKGKDAVNGSKVVLQKLEELKKATLSQVHDPDAQRLLSKSIDARIITERARIQTHALKGQQEWDLSLAKTGAEQAAEEASLYVTDPKKVAAATTVIEQNLRVSMQGMPEESIVEARDNLLSKALAAGIIEKSKLDPALAKHLFEQYRDKLEADDYRRVENVVIEQERLQRAEAAVATIRSQHPWDLEAQVEAARGLFGNDVKLQDEVKRRLTLEYTRDKTAREEGNRLAYETLADRMMLQGIPLDTLRKQFPEEISRLTAAQYSNLLKIEKDRAKGKVYTTDWAAWTQIMEMTPQQLKDMNPIDYRRKLDDKHYDKLLKMVKEARQGKDDTHVALRSTKDTIDYYVRRVFGVEGQDLKDKMQEAYKDLEPILNELAKEKKPSQTEINQVIDQYFMTRHLPQYGFFSRSFEDTPIAAADMDNISPLELKQIKEAYAKLNIPEPSEDQILYLWRYNKMKQVIGADKLDMFNTLQRLEALTR
ncbi:MAG: hypothetical protein D6698_15610 [Gammaproteobacteria bacterium]|nr:MAG: hypothetical protein D6698_15610 [Gammaproteobacteria bacterium]